MAASNNHTHYSSSEYSPMEAWPGAESPGPFACGGGRVTSMSNAPPHYEGLMAKIAAAEGSTVGSINADFSSLGDEFDENSRREAEILNENRVKLIEYVHDCSVLHPYMKEKKVFNVEDCQLIQHEVTGAQRMDKFVDIVLTKGPKATGVFHEALKKPYPYVFDILTRLFTSAGIELPESRQIIADPPDIDPPSLQASGSVRRRHTTYRPTIRKHIDELTERCEVVKNQRDELQKALIQRERDINALMNHREVVIQKKYEDMLALLAQWRETVTHQSDGNIQKMQELLTQQEGIRQAYEMLEGDYMLMESELSAARDRISKLITHLQKRETEFSLAQEAKEALSDKLSYQEGEIQRLYRRFERIGKDHTHSRDQSPTVDSDLKPTKHCSESSLYKNLEERLKEYEEKMKVCQIERRDALEERDSLKFKLYGLEKELKKKTREHKAFKHSLSEPPDLKDLLSVKNAQEPLSEETVIMPAHDSGMKIGLAIVVRELTDTGNALQCGVQIGDEIHQVNHINLKPELSFTQQILESASNTITLSIKRQASHGQGQGASRSKPRSPLMTPITPLDITSLYESFLPKGTSSLSSGHPRHQHQKLKSFFSHPYSSASSGKSLDNLERDFSESEDSDENHAHSEPEYTSEGFSEASQEQRGILASPGRSEAYRAVKSTILDSMILELGEESSQHKRRSKETMLGKVFPEPGSNSSPDGGEGYSSRVPESTSYNSDSPGPNQDPNESPRKHRSRNALRRKGKNVRNKRQPESTSVPQPRLSKSMDELDLMWPAEVYLSDEIQNKEDGSKMVILPSGHLGVGLSIVGGRGNGLYIMSERSSNRSLRTGDRILHICGRSTAKMTYAEAMELLKKSHCRDKCFLLVKNDIEGYQKLGAYSRDNFYVRTKLPHKSRSRLELSFEEGDVFHVTDTKPQELNNMWQVEKLGTRGQIVETGCIPINIEFNEFPMGNNMGYHSLPPQLIHKSPHLKKMSNIATMQNQKQLGNQQVPAHFGFKLYQPVSKVVVTEPRPVVLMGVFDTELSEYLVGKAPKDGGAKFAFPNREPKEKLKVEEHKIIESLSVADGILHSTSDDIAEMTRCGYHCVLKLTTSDLAKSKVTTLRPIVIALWPHGKSVRVKQAAGRYPGIFSRESLGQDAISAVKDKIKRIQKLTSASTGLMTELEIPSSIHVDDLATNIHDTVVEQQRTVFWELDST